MGGLTKNILLQNLLLFLVSTLMTLALAEGGFRLYSKLTEDEGIKALNRDRVIPSSGQVVELGHMVQLAENPRIIYEFFPNLSVVHRGVPVDINSAGFRGQLVAPDKPPGRKRIVGIGDSVMYGWGVEEEASYLSVLAEKLHATQNGERWDIINTAVPGYNTAMEVEVLADKGLQYQPDVVIVGFVSNDFSLPNFIRNPTDYLALNRSFILDYLRLGKAAPVQAMTNTPDEFMGGMRLHDIELEKVPPLYRDMVGLSGVLQSFERLSNLRDTHDFEVVILANHWFPAELVSAAKSHGFHLLNARTLWNTHASTQHYPDAEAMSRLSEDDPHPSVRAHQVIGEGLFELLRTLGEFQSNTGVAQSLTSSR